jgi:hypothetical protein
VEEPTGRTIVGTYPPPGTTADVERPEQGFGYAIKDAVDRIAKEWGADDAPYEVTIRLEARVDVTNPGDIGVYRAVVSE